MTVEAGAALEVEEEGGDEVEVDLMRIGEVGVEVEAETEVGEAEVAAVAAA